MKGKLWVAFLAAVLALAALSPPVHAAEKGEWTLLTPPNYSGNYGEAITGAGDFIYLIVGGETDSYFLRYNTITGQWEELAQPGVMCRTGTVLAWDNGDYIYALMGNSTTTTNHYFYRYSISRNSWTALADTGGEQGEGDSMAWVKIGGKEYIYATTRGEQRPTYLERYSISDGTWEYMIPPPAGMGDGASMVWDGGNYLYVLRGEDLETSPTYDFWRYDLTNNTWSSLENIPASPHSGGRGGVGDGGSLVYPGLWDPRQADYIYAMSGNQCYPEKPKPIYDNRFYRYTISTDSWELMAETPYPVGNYVGCRLAYAGGKIYWWQGSPSTVEGGGNAFARYTPPNRPPTLTSGSVDLSKNAAGATFTFEVTYTDSDGDAPLYVKVYIDNVGYSMTKISGDYMTGAIYRYSWTTISDDIGSHTYYFSASDGTDAARLPTSSTYSGPTVTEAKPTPGPSDLLTWVVVAVVVVCPVGVIIFIRRRREGEEFEVRGPHEKPSPPHAGVPPSPP